MDELPAAIVNKMTPEEFANYQARGQKGDIVVVRPDGWEWGNDEGLPRYVVVKVPELSYEEAKVYEESLTEEGKVLRKRKHSFSKTDVDTAIRRKRRSVKRTGRSFQSKVSKKRGLQKEVIQPKKDLLSLWRYQFKAYTRNFGVAWAASQLKKTVKPSGGDYTSLEACMDANEQNLVDNDKYFDVEIDGEWSSADTTAVMIHNYTTDATRYINIYTTATARHRGYLDTERYRIVTGGATTATLNTNATNFLYINGIVTKNTSTYNAIDNCGLYGGSTTTAGVQIYRNSIFIGGCVGARVGADNRYAKFYNCIAISHSTSDANGGRNAAWLITGASSSASTSELLNCVGVAYGNGTASVFNNNTAGAYNYVVKNSYGAQGGSGTGDVFHAKTVVTTSASSDGSKDTSTVAYATDSGAYFTNITNASENFHIGASSELINEGTDLSATFTDDIDGQTRPTGANSWDIGADEYFSGEPPPLVTRRIMVIQ
jgi:hypothetical protein